MMSSFRQSNAEQRAPSDTMPTVQGSSKDIADEAERHTLGRATLAPSETRGSWSLRSRLIPVLLLAVYVAQAIWFIRTQSLTVDEPEHIFAGMQATRYGKFERSLEHPPLARVWMALFLPRHGAPQITVAPDPRVQGPIEDPEALALRARLPILLFGLILGVLLWSLSRRLWSESAANFALALFAFSPSLITHFSLATTDGAGVLMVFATAFQLLRWRDNPNWVQTLLLGALLGLLLLAKLYTPPYFLLTLLLVLFPLPTAPQRRNGKPAAIMLIIALFVLWMGYFFHVTKVSVHNGELQFTPDITLTAPASWNADLRVPAAEYLEGIVVLIAHNGTGHANYFLGEVSRNRHPLYFPVVIALKWPMMVLLITAAAVVLLARKRLPAPPALVMLLMFPVLALALTLGANLNIGERHILPVYPFALLLAAGAWEAAHSYARNSNLQPNWKRYSGMGVLLLALVLNAADVLRYAPDYLSYFNVFVSPRHSYRYLSSSNLDWGGGLIALREYQKQHPGETIHLAYYGIVAPRSYGIEAKPLAEGERTTGTVVVSASHLTGQYLKDPLAYRWLLQYEPKTILNHSLFVFQVP